MCGIVSIHSAEIQLPPRRELISHVICSLGVYWGKSSALILKLPISNLQSEIIISIPLKLKAIELPNWAAYCGIKNELLVPQECIPNNFIQTDWQKVDWWLAIFLMLEGWHERIWEKANGCIHSYSYKLKGWDTRAWEHAWVNRIALFMREWVLQTKNLDEVQIFGCKPKPFIHISFDVDAISKTIPIRIKQSCFNFFNAARLARQLKFIDGLEKIYKGIKFLLSFENWDKFDYLIGELEKRKIKATFNFFSGQRSNLKAWIMDPGYDINSPKIKTLIHKLHARGHSIGLHPSYDSYTDSIKLRSEKKALEDASGIKVHSSRQHWLRFEWASTLQNLEEAQILKDTTLMFNDRHGFRTSSCIEWNSWNHVNQIPHKIKSLPTFLMDSHLYDYNLKRNSSHKEDINHLMDECKNVYGHCFVVWHPHTLTNDYNWNEAFDYLLENLF